MKIFTICPQSFAANTYLLISDSTAVVIDPAVSVSALKRKLDEENAEIKAILLTHGHFDHTVSVDTVRDFFNIPLYIHKNDAPMLTDGRINGFFDFYGRECVRKAEDKTFSDKELLTFGGIQLHVLHTPGHSPGSVCFECKDDDENTFLITGDTLFSNSIGRTDLWQGDEQALARSLGALKKYSPLTQIYPGHGESASLGYALEEARYYLNF